MRPETARYTMPFWRVQIDSPIPLIFSETEPLNSDVATIRGEKQQLDRGSRPTGLQYTPKYREKNIYRRQLQAPDTSKPISSREQLMDKQVQNLGFSKTFLRLHFLILYVVQMAVQFGIVIWSVVNLGGGNVVLGASQTAAITTIDITITVLLVVDLFSHLADDAKIFWRDW
jgi:hypothetical protein